MYSRYSAESASSATKISGYVHRYITLCDATIAAISRLSRNVLRLEDISSRPCVTAVTGHRTVSANRASTIKTKPSVSLKIGRMNALNDRFRPRMDEELARCSWDANGNPGDIFGEQSQSQRPLSNAMSLFRYMRSPRCPVGAVMQCRCHDKSLYSGRRAELFAYVSA